MRIGEGILLGMVYVGFFLMHTSQPAPFRRKVMVLLAAVGTFGFLLGVGGIIWWFGAVPTAMRMFVVASVLTHYVDQYPWIFWTLNTVAPAVLVAMLVTLVLLRRWVWPTRLLLLAAIPAIFGLGAEFEFMREFMRNPYLMPGYMYTNQKLLTEALYYRDHPVLADAYWYNVPGRLHTDINAGAYLFKLNCGVCHTTDGLSSIRVSLKGRPADAIYVIAGRTNDMVPFMSPFSGTPHERHLLANFLHELIQGHLEQVEPYGYVRRPSRQGGSS